MNTWQQKASQWGRYLCGASPFFILFAVLVLYALAYNILIQCVFVEDECNQVPQLRLHVNDLLEKQEVPNVISEINGFAGRINWAVATSLNLILSIATLMLAGCIATRAGRYYPRVPGLSIILFGVATITGLLAKELMSNSSDAESPWKHFLHEELRGDLPVAEKIISHMDAAGVVISIYLGLSVASLLIAAIYKEDEWLKEASRHSSLLNISLYVSSLFLVIGVFRIASLFEWSLAYVNPAAFDPDGRDLVVFTSLFRVAGNIVNSRGVLYTAMLAAIYLPTAVFMGSRVFEIKNRKQPKAEEMEAWLQQWSFSTQIPKFIAIVSPALSGPAADYLQILR